MAKQIIVLETNPADGGSNSISCAFWFPVPANQQIVDNTRVSAFKNANTQEQTDIQSGAVLEEVQEIRLPSSFTTAQIKGALVAAYTDRKTYLASLPNKGQYYGVSYDGTAWSA